MTVPQPLIEAIMNGRFDESLSQLETLIQHRRTMIGQQLLLALNAGDRVRFNHRTRPKYLRGLVCTIQRVEGSNAYVNIPRAIGKYREGSVVGTPATLLDRV